VLTITGSMILLMEIPAFWKIARLIKGETNEMKIDRIK